MDGAERATAHGAPQLEPVVEVLSKAVVGKAGQCAQAWPAHPASWGWHYQLWLVGEGPRDKELGEKHSVGLGVGCPCVGELGRPGPLVRCYSVYSVRYDTKMLN